MYLLKKIVCIRHLIIGLKIEEFYFFLRIVLN